MSVETELDRRGMVTRGIVQSVNDTGDVQTVTVKTADGFTYADVEVEQPFGFSSSPPLDGATVMLFAVGGDPAHFVAMPLANRTRRFGNQASGETTIYAHDGTRVALRRGGVVEVWGATLVKVNGKNVTVTAAEAVAFVSPKVTMSGDLEVAGDVSDGHGKLSGLRGHYNAHHNPGGGATDQPD